MDTKKLHLAAAFSTAAMILLLGATGAAASFFEQINENGFGNPHTTGGLERHTMAVFKDKLYVGAANRNDGAVVMAWDEKKWTQVSKNGFGTPANTAITCLYATDKKLYAGTSNEAGGEVWEYDGASWRCLHKGPFGKFVSNLIQGVAYYKGRVYVGLWDQIETKPVEVWAGTGPGNWELVGKPGLGDVELEAIPSMEVSSVDGAEKLYVAVWKDFQYRKPDSGAEIWSFDGKTWEKRNRGREGFGELNKGRPGMEPLALFDFNKRLYVGLWSFGAGTKGELWSFDGKDWVKADFAPSYASIYTLAAANGKLYAVSSSVYGKYELWENDGASWRKILCKGCPTPDNFGNTDNTNISTMAGFRGRLYLGVTNNQAGFKVYRSAFPEITPAMKSAPVGTAELLGLSVDLQASKWTTSNPDAASVDPRTGFFTARAPGASIIAAANDYGAGLASRQITVTTGQAVKKNAVSVYAEITPRAGSIDNSTRLVATATPYLLGDVGAAAQVRIDLSAVGGTAQDMVDDGTNGDSQKGDGVFSSLLAIPKATKPGLYGFPVTVATSRGKTGVGKAFFKVNQGYTAPRLTYLKAKSGVYHLPVMFCLSDPDGDDNSVTFEYKKEGDAAWSPATVYSQSGMLASAGAPGGKMNRLAKLKTNRELNHYVCVWESEKDIGQSAGAYRLRATPADAKSAGAPLVSDPLQVDNQAPPKDEMVYVPSGNFYIDKYEFPNHPGYYPLLRLTWKEACAQCEKVGKKLCTPEQWEAAYYGTKKLRYPYGPVSKVSGRDYCNTYGSKDSSAVPSGLYENCVNDLGIYDMGGNVYEWSSRNENEVFMADQSYLLTSIDATLYNVEGPDHRHEFLGIRCCKEAEKKK